MSTPRLLQWPPAGQMKRKEQVVTGAEQLTILKQTPGNEDGEKSKDSRFARRTDNLRHGLRLQACKCSSSSVHSQISS